MDRSTGEAFADPEGYYRTLGCQPQHSAATIAQEYRARAKLLHPDQRRHPPQQQAAEGVGAMERLNEAYAVLGNQERRRCYDHFRSASLDIGFAEWVRLYGQAPGGDPFGPSVHWRLRDRTLAIHSNHPDNHHSPPDESDQKADDTLQAKFRRYQI